MGNKVKQCKHDVKLAFNNDEIVSYCTKCGKILDRYVKVNGHINYYYTYPSTTPNTTPNPNYWGPNWTCTTGDPYSPEMGSHTSTLNPNIVTDTLTVNTGVEGTHAVTREHNATSTIRG